MSLVQRDFIRRLIAQLGEFLARLVALSDKKQLDEAIALVNETERELIGPLLGTIEEVDARTAAMLLGSADKLRLYALLVAERAKLFALAGRADEARRDARRSLELYRALGPSAELAEADAAAREAARRLSEPPDPNGAR